MVRIKCPGCGATGTIVNEGERQHANDDENPITLVPPEGFRKVQVGWRSGELHLYCVNCGVPAEIDQGDSE